MNPKNKITRQKIILTYLEKSKGKTISQKELVEVSVPEIKKVIWKIDPALIQKEISILKYIIKEIRKKYPKKRIIFDKIEKGYCLEKPKK